MATLVRTSPLQYLLNRFLVIFSITFLIIHFFFQDAREQKIPGKFVVYWMDSLHLGQFESDEIDFLKKLELKLHENHSFEFNYDIEGKGKSYGTWKFSGPINKKLLYISYDDKHWHSIDFCLDTGWYFAYPIQSLDRDGNGRILTFKKIENFY